VTFAVGHQEIGHPLADAGDEEIGVAGFQALNEFVVSGLKIRKNLAGFCKIESQPFIERRFNGISLVEGLG
jgi:hypothetical protein